MSDQPTLPIVALVDAPTPADLTIQQRFEAFHEANPWVYDVLVQLTRDWLQQGHERVGIGMLFEVIRWQYSRATQGEVFRLNNSLRSRYARKIISDNPDLAAAFETRALKAA